MSDRELILRAMAVREKAYAPYSGFAVGAALLGKNGKVYTGCNIENAAYSPTNCAERTAFFKAVSEGVREFEKIAVAGGRLGEEPNEMCAPCGICRQVMAEFCDAETFEIILGNAEKQERYLLKELLPMSFGAEQFKETGKSYDDV